MLYIKRAEITNVRCFKHAVVEFDLKGDERPWTMLIGDNATGKTTLLKALALGLCDRSSAAGLLRESELGYVRDGAREARIVLDLVPSDNPSRRPYQTVTTITRGTHGELDQLDQTVRPKVGFPWDQVFACGYGAGPGMAGAGDISGYSVINSVYSLFNYAEGLQNPELSMRRLGDAGVGKQIESLLTDVMDVTDVTLSSSGIVAAGWWGEGTPYRDLADAYKSVLLWITDLAGWAWTQQPELNAPKEIDGIVLVDEIEQHLHPKLQRRVVPRLRQLFPKIQFITTTHSPLVASSVGATEGTSPDRLIHLSTTQEGDVAIRPIQTMRGWRSDQILESVAFDWLTQYPFEAIANETKQWGTVTILFTDIESSTQLNARLGDVAFRQVQQEHEELIEKEVKAAGGLINKEEGDGMMLVFSKAGDAVRCAIGIQRACAYRNQAAKNPFVVRIGIETGEPVQAKSDFFGQSVATAKRISDQAAGGEILVSETVQHLVKQSGEFTIDPLHAVKLKGFEETLQLYKVAWNTEPSAQGT